MYRTSSFITNTKGYLSEQGGYDVRGRPIFLERVKIGLNVITLETDIESTSIRADSSASKSRAQEQKRTGRVLIEPKANFKVGDMLELLGEKWKIDRKNPRLDQSGRLHHYQADIVSWV